MTCALCRDDVTEATSVVVSFAGDLRDVCDSCMEKADEGEPIEERLDMLREGLPEFNGAFSTW